MGFLLRLYYSGIAYELWGSLACECLVVFVFPIYNIYMYLYIYPIETERRLISYFPIFGEQQRSGNE